ncbi:hypothetical protein PQ455_14460 [Sphingomonas naphthae]|uniref:Uncharacterized protein n=1 Tax=Sphingomonas naphthae TaxID=1813468 RepID=A0ABY7TI59_9SPHN|nr:hypothetical protein [Sphingomonas naphthae]WCT72829.1 hypothetical protein PQ455_14460 [Sphingomonas naphthae]
MLGRVCRCVGLGALVALAACVEQKTPQVAQAPVAATVPAAPVALSQDWREAAVTVGRWSFVADPRGPQAVFGRPGVEPDVVLRCDLGRRMVAVTLPGTGAQTLTVQTSSGNGQVPAVAMPGSLPGGPPYQGAWFAARDPFLDRIAFSRGRLAIGVSGRPALILPAWAEPTRVVEDCRR